MPKILRILNRFNLGGPMHNTAYLTKYLPEEYNTILIGGEKDSNETDSEFLLKQMNIPYVVLPTMKRSIGFVSEIKAWRTIVQIIRREKPGRHPLERKRRDLHRRGDGRVHDRRNRQRAF